MANGLVEDHSIGAPLSQYPKWTVMEVLEVRGAQLATTGEDWHACRELYMHANGGCNIRYEVARQGRASATSPHAARPQ